MNIFNPYRFGEAASQGKTLISFGSVRTINSINDITNRTSLNVNEIENLIIQDNVVSFNAKVNYSINEAAFFANNRQSITSYIDLEGKVIQIGLNAFNNASDILEVFIFPNLNSYVGVRNFAQSSVTYKQNILKICNIKSTTQVGSTNLSDDVFEDNKSNLTCYVNLACATNNSGGLDADLVGVNTVRFNSNSFTPDAVGTINEDSKGGGFLNISWSAPTSSNPVDVYIIFLNNAYKGVSNTTNFQFLGLVPSTLYDVKILTIDNQGNISPFSTTQQFTTNSTYTIPTGNIVSYYKLDSNSNDFVGSNNGTPTDITYTTGIVNNAAEYNNSSSIINIPDSNDLSFGNGTTDTPFSISFWVYQISLNSTIFYTNKRDASFIEYNVYYSVSRNGYSFALFSDSTDVSADRYILETGVTPKLNVWEHICATYDGSSNSNGLKFYIDGQSITNTNVEVTGVYTAMDNTTAPLILGSFLVSPTVRLNGRLDETLIWNKELSQNEVKDLYSKNLLGLETTQ